MYCPQNEKANKDQTAKKQSDTRNNSVCKNDCDCKQKKYCFRTLAWDDPDNTLSYKLCFGHST